MTLQRKVDTARSLLSQKRLTTANLS